jgi:hypothetical protein
MTDIMSRVDKFNNVHTAFNYAERCIKGHMVLHGDDGKYWVAVMAVAAQLERMGYEVVTRNMLGI